MSGCTQRIREGVYIRAGGEAVVSEVILFPEEEDQMEMREKLSEI